MKKFMNEVLIDEEDRHLLTMNSWRIVKGYLQRHRPVGQREIMFHRLIVTCPPGFFVDHINGNKLDNRRSNLRIVTPSQSVQNTGRCRDGSSIFKGVCLDKKTKKWQAQITWKDKDAGKTRSKYLGQFRCQTVAAMAYDRAAIEMFGEYARPNFGGRK